MWLGLISSLVGIVGFLFLVYPRISISPGTPLDLSNPFQTPFILKNDGYLSIFDINYSLGIENVEDMNHNVFSGGMIGGVSKMNTIPRLNPNKTSALFISSTFVGPPNFIKHANIYISIKYRPFLVPFSFTENIRFKTERKNTGEYIWLEDYSK